MTRPCAAYVVALLLLPAHRICGALKTAQSNHCGNQRRALHGELNARRSVGFRRGEICLGIRDGEGPSKYGRTSFAYPVASLRAGATGDGATLAVRRPVDFVAILKYVVGLSVQTSLIYAFFAIFVDKIVMSTLLKGKLGIETIPTWVNFLFFYAFNLKTSVFSVLPINKRRGDQLDKEWENMERNRPWWTPPGYVFALMWPLFVFGTRAFAASRVVGILGGVYANRAVMALMLHLCVANLWNTINNIERRLGVSVIILYLLAVTKAYAAYEFWKIDKLSGRLLASTLTWLTAAAALETHTWLINPDRDTGKVEPLYPAKADGKWKTIFRWEQ